MIYPNAWKWLPVSINHFPRHAGCFRSEQLMKQMLAGQKREGEDKKEH